MISLPLQIKSVPLETRPDSPREPGMQPRDPCLPWRGKLGPGHTLRWTWNTYKHTQAIFTKTDHMQCQKTSLYKFQRTEII